ncbi:MAG: translocation/assembly module TamB domain-containing protein [Deltaproteobacteria bacterium]|nr:translocation/assembly module TamB domain-containing protein [Deltaproteobacteria bacterium]
MLTYVLLLRKRMLLLDGLSRAKRQDIAKLPPIELRRPDLSRIEILSKKDDVQCARVRFSGKRVPNPDLDVKLSRRFGDATIFIMVRGTARKPQLELTANPAIYDSSQIVSLIITGRVDPRKGSSQTDNTMAVASAVGPPMVRGDVLAIREKA